ncbi:adenine deaminase [Desulfosarcina sp. OttesenSCG-928-A07]|nr:adenine deaminase [Desulfosarcina sp. OttesenSCG-928-G17]MDL2330280.1 adenine deaminase [Desulfosarcina sp. OttesenSCG-928-A07]
MTLETVVAAARGDIPADLLLVNGQIINVFSGRITAGHIAVKDGYVVGIGDYDAKKVTDLAGRYVSPGFIDAHVHIESAMVSVAEFSRAVVARGTTTVIADPHEIANVLGCAGIQYMLRSAADQPMDCLFTLPSCVPATAMETAGARLKAADLEPFFQHPRIVGLGEMMNYPGVVFKDPDVMDKLALARRLGRPMDGHAPGLSGRLLSAYAATGISSDHECTRPDEATEKLEAGICIMVREGTAARNLDDLFPVISPDTWPRMMWCTDDRHPHDILSKGHIDAMIRKAVKKGLDPITAIRMATLCPATHFGLGDVGAIAPGKKANFVVFSRLDDIRPEMVFFRGHPQAEDGRLLPHVTRPAEIPIPTSIHLSSSALDFSIPAVSPRIRVIRALDNQVVTDCDIMDTAIRAGMAESDVSRDLIKLAVVERYTGHHGIGKGFVTGLGLKHGAICSSVAHDSHNIIVAGATDAEMKTAVDQVIRMKGGLCVVSGETILTALPLPIAGLMSDQPMEQVEVQMERLLLAAKKLGTPLSDVFMTLSFLALPVIPALKLTDRGLVDVEKFTVVPLFQ